MKPKLAFAWFLVSLALAAVLLVQIRGGRRQKILMEKLQVQVEKLDQQEKTAQARAAELEKEARKLRAELRGTEVDLSNTRLAYHALLQMTNAPQGQAARPQASRDQNPPASMGAFFSNMMKDPEMRKAMEQQQRMGLDLVYGSLYQHLKLSPDQEKQFRDALLSLQMTNMMQAGALFEPGNTNRTAIAEQMAADRKVAEEKIQEILGEEKYAQFQDYNQTLSERMMLDQFAKQTEIAPEKTEQLLSIIREEKKNMQINMGGAMDPAQNFQQLLESGQAEEQMFAHQEIVNERVLERASQVLTPEQMAKFRPALTNQLALQKAGLKMARQMMQDQPAPAPPAPPQPVP